MISIKRMRACGTWQPARLTGGDMWLLVIDLALISNVRWIDYATGDDVRTSTTYFEQIMPLWAWAIFFGIGAFALTLGVTMRRHMAVWAGHGLLATAYGALGLSYLLDTLSLWTLGSWPDGLRTVGLFSVPTVLHVILCLRTGPRATDGKRMHTTEAITAPDVGGDRA